MCAASQSAMFVVPAETLLTMRVAGLGEMLVRGDLHGLVLMSVKE